MIITYKNSSGEKLFNYKLTYRSNQKKIILSIKNNIINISCPFNFKQKIINNFIINNLFEIQELIKKYNKNRLLSFDDDDPFVYILGTKYKIILVDQNIRTKIFDNKLFIKKKSIEAEQIKLLYSFLRREYNNLFIELLSKWVNITDEKVNNLNIYVMNSKWGMCYKKIRKIILNIKLIHFTCSVIEYVILHEICHLEFIFHDIHFWNKVQFYISNYKDHNNILKQFYI